MGQTSENQETGKKRLGDVKASIVIHTVKGFGRVNEAEVDVFQEFSCFFYDLVDVGNLVSGSVPLPFLNPA